MNPKDQVRELLRPLADAWRMVAKDPEAAAALSDLRPLNYVPAEDDSAGSVAPSMVQMPAPAM